MREVREMGMERSDESVTPMRGDGWLLIIRKARRWGGSNRTRGEQRLHAWKHLSPLGFGCPLIFYTYTKHLTLSASVGYICSLSTCHSLLFPLHAMDDLESHCSLPIGHPRQLSLAHTIIFPLTLQSLTGYISHLAYQFFVHITQTLPRWLDKEKSPHESFDQYVA